MTTAFVPCLDGVEREFKFPRSVPFDRDTPAVGEYFMFMGGLYLRINDSLVDGISNVFDPEKNRAWDFVEDPGFAYHVM